MTIPASVREPAATLSATSTGPWMTIVWDDPVNLMSYVTYVFQTLFGYDEAKATRLMLDVHNTGKVAVSSGPRERMEHDVTSLHAYGLMATLQQSG